MITTPAPHREHPLAVLVARLHGELDEAAGLPVWSLGPAEAGAVLVSLTRLGSELEAHPVTGEALTAGRVLADQAAVIVRAVEELPDDLDPALVVKAEVHLLGLAADFDAKALRRLGRSLLGVVAPEVGEAHEAAALAMEERDAAASARLSTVQDGHGRVHGRFTLPSVQGAMLKKALLGIAAPKHRAGTTGHAPGRPDPLVEQGVRAGARASSKPPQRGQPFDHRGFDDGPRRGLGPAQPAVAVG